MDDLISRQKLIKEIENITCQRERNSYLYRMLMKLVVEAPVEKLQQEDKRD